MKNKELIKINDNLRKNIFSSLPQDYSNLEKALYIYKQLCEKLQYSMEYYVDEDNVKSKYANINNLQLVDGEKNKDVVCFTFNAILGELLYEADVCDNLEFLSIDKQNNFSTIHDGVLCIIDGIQYFIDATYRVLDNNDLILTKYSNFKPSGWELCDETQNSEMLNNAIEKVYSDELNHSNIVNAYKLQKAEDYLDLPLKKRVDIFLKMSKNFKDYTLGEFNYLLKLKRIIFSNQELNGTKDAKFGSSIDKMIELSFLKDEKTNTLKAFLLYNPKGYTDDKDYENFDSLSIFEIDVKNKQTKKIDPKIFKENLDKRYRLINGNRKMEMISEGHLHVRDIIEGNPVYDNKQRLVNKIIGQERYIVKKQKYEPYKG